MFKNPSFITRKYGCNKQVANYLVHKMSLPLLGLENNRYYFLDNAVLKESLRKLPLWLKLIKNF